MVEETSPAPERPDSGKGSEMRSGRRPGRGHRGRGRRSAPRKPLGQQEPAPAATDAAGEVDSPSVPPPKGEGTQPAAEDYAAGVESFQTEPSKAPEPSSAQSEEARREFSEPVSQSPPAHESTPAPLPVSERAQGSSRQFPERRQPEIRPHRPPPQWTPAAQTAVEKAIEEVNAIIEKLKEALDDMDEVLETLELAERQKNADEQEIESLRRALRGAHAPRSHEHREQRPPQGYRGQPRDYGSRENRGENAGHAQRDRGPREEQSGNRAQD